MRKNLFLYSFVFWWAVMFPILNFTERELIQINDNTIEFKSFILEILH